MADLPWAAAPWGPCFSSTWSGSWPSQRPQPWPSHSPSMRPAAPVGPPEGPACMQEQTARSHRRYSLPAGEWIPSFVS